MSPTVTRILITVFFAACGVIIAASAFYRTHASELSGTVASKGADLCSGTCPVWVRPDRRWLEVKDGRGVHVVPVTQSVYDACWVDAFNPAPYPQCARGGA